MKRSRTWPADYVPKFTPGEVDRRALYLTDRCFAFLEGFRSRHRKWNLEFDPLVMMNVAVSAMDDIWRYKSYHLQDARRRSDGIKRAVYFVKWIVRLRPIYFVRPVSAELFAKSFDKNDSTLLINECFALHLAFGTLATEAGRPKLLIRDAEVYADLLYDLHYRSLSEDALMEIFQLLRDDAKGKRLTVTA